MKLGEVISLNKESLIEISNDADYKILGVKSYGKGVVIKQEVSGSALKMRKYKVAKKNQLMWCKVDTKNGAFGITKEKDEGCIASTNMALADINTNKIIPEFLELLFRNKFFYEDINKNSTGTTNRKYLKPWEVCEKIEIPDLTKDQQKRLLDNYLFIENCGLLQNVDKNLKLISKLRQAILSEAVQGKLVPQDLDDEPASVLLEKIKAEKPALMKKKKIKKEKSFNGLTEEELPYNLPENWIWGRFNDIVALRRGASPRPIKSYITTSDEGVNWIKIGDTGASKYVTSTNEKVTKQGAEKSVFVSEGELIMSNSMSFGRPYILKINGCIHDGWLSISFSTNLLDIDFLYYLLSAQQAYYEEKAKGTGVRNLNIDRVAEMPIPLPPLNEQKRIVAKVDQLMQLCDQLEFQVKENQKNSEALMNSVLREAFEVKA